MSKSIIDKFILFKISEHETGYFQKSHSTDSNAVSMGYYNMTQDQVRVSKVIGKYEGKDAAVAYWDYHFNLLSAETRELIKIVMPELEKSDKSTLKHPREIAALAYEKAKKVIGITCPKCSGLGWYPSSIGNGTCFNCRGRGKLLPKLTPEVLAELSKHFGCGKQDEIKTVCIPACENHKGLHIMQVNLRWICPICGKPRGEIKQGRSYDGSLCLICDTWQNPCGHTDFYSAVRKEAQENGLNGGDT